MKPLTILCDAGVHCGTCRDLDGGREWRKSIATVFDAPKDSDFACPRGKPWGAPSEPPQPPPPPPDPIPRDKWPLAVRAIAKRATDGEKGVGDTVQRLLGEAGEKFKRMSKRIGIDCRCDARQSHLNAIYPY